jgi:hypothetical protein
MGGKPSHLPKDATKTIVVLSGCLTSLVRLIERNENEMNWINRVRVLDEWAGSGSLTACY